MDLAVLLISSYLTCQMSDFRFLALGTTRSSLSRAVFLINQLVELRVTGLVLINMSVSRVGSRVHGSLSLLESTWWSLRRIYSGFLG